MARSSYVSRLREKIGHELLLLPSVTLLAFDEHHRVLLVRHADTGVWVAPGGSIEPDETPADAAAREMWEETGLTVELLRVIGVYGGPEFRVRYASGDEVSYLMTVFECRALAGEPRPDGREALEVGYFTRADLDGLELAPWARVVLPDAFGDRAGTRFRPPSWRPPGASRVG